MTLSPTSNVTSPPVGSACMGRPKSCRQSFKYSRRAAQNSTRNGQKSATFCQFGPAWPLPRPNALKYQTGTRLRDLIRARQRLQPHVPALTLFTRTARQRHFKAQARDIPLVRGPVPAKLDRVRAQEVGGGPVIAMFILDPGEQR